MVRLINTKKTGANSTLKLRRHEMDRGAEHPDDTNRKW